LACCFSPIVALLLVVGSGHTAGVAAGSRCSGSVAFGCPLSFHSNMSQPKTMARSKPFAQRTARRAARRPLSGRLAWFVRPAAVCTVSRSLPVSLRARVAVSLPPSSGCPRARCCQWSHLRIPNFVAELRAASVHLTRAIEATFRYDSHLKRTSIPSEISVRQVQRFSIVMEAICTVSPC